MIRDIVQGGYLVDTRPPTLQHIIEIADHMAKVTARNNDAPLLCMLVGVKTVKGVYASGGYKAIRKLKTKYDLRATPRASRLIMMASKKKKTFKEWLVLRKL